METKLPSFPTWYFIYSTLLTIFKICIERLPHFGMLLIKKFKINVKSLEFNKYTSSLKRQ
ncbi:hypothetical protein FD41_GL000758 [Lentilactobacillus farraginis DSM 18382 = JCM 14108]|uniref:Uncharacterized protein n=1 Tax=Lentilactobacillus farraginis DSM 18382 = JCM 14108 TaxID=1423743 RepID=A0A0R1VI78_9LACO|nr:hypothetical protein FD41_GL000758 [Lentilactobacillus farraginis DSM 18382 = JCM 14108]